MVFEETYISMDGRTRAVGRKLRLPTTLTGASNVLARLELENSSIRLQ